MAKQNNNTDRELKALMRGQAVSTGSFEWEENPLVGKSEQRAHTILGLDPANPDLEKRLALYQDILTAYGFINTRRSSRLAGTTVPGESYNDWIVSTVGTLKTDSAIIKTMLAEGTLDRFHKARNDSERLAAILGALL